MQEVTDLQNQGEKINYLMYMDDMRIFAKNKKKERQTLIQIIIIIHSQEIGIEFGTENGPYW